ncbi:MAG: hypothetical protein OEZ22_05370 [Spirochaetia bacterium]|nr:hypothetical protein [Spirochaetia bacterium]
MINEKKINKELILEIEELKDEIKIIWRGKSTEMNPGEFLNPVFTELLRKQKALIMDFRHFEYMNSSTITPIIRILEQIKNGKEKLSLLYSKDLKWQELSFSALEIFKTNDNRINILSI